MDESGDVSQKSARSPGMTELFTKTPPTEPGWYWACSRGGEAVIHVTGRDGDFVFWTINGEVFDLHNPSPRRAGSMDMLWRFGPRIPSPQECADASAKASDTKPRYTLADVHAVCVSEGVSYFQDGRGLWHEMEVLVKPMTAEEQAEFKNVFAKDRREMKQGTVVIPPKGETVSHGVLTPKDPGVKRWDIKTIEQCEEALRYANAMICKYNAEVDVLNAVHVRIRDGIHRYPMLKTYPPEESLVRYAQAVPVVESLGVVIRTDAVAC